LPRDQTPTPDRLVGLSRGADAMATVWADGFRVRPSVCQWPLGPSEVWAALADPRVDFTSSPLPVGILSAPTQSINSLSDRSFLPVPTHFSPDFQIAFAGRMARRCLIQKIAKKTDMNRHANSGGSYQTSLLPGFSDPRKSQQLPPPPGGKESVPPPAPKPPSSTPPKPPLCTNAPKRGGRAGAYPARHEHATHRS